MAIDQLNNAWASYRYAVNRFYAVAGPALGDGQSLEDGAAVERADAALADALVWSQQLGEIGIGLCREPECRNRGHDEISVLLVAVAAVDGMLAYDGLRVAPKPTEPVEPLAPDPRLVELANAVEAEPTETILAEADTLFGLRLSAAGGGQEVDRQEFLRECIQTLDALLNAATAPAMQFGFAAVSTGAAQLIDFAVTGVVPMLGEIAQRTGWVRRHAVGLLREGMRKLLADDEALVELALNRLRQEVPSQGELKGGPLIGAIAGYTPAKSKAKAAIDSTPALPAYAVGLVRTDLGALTSAYRERMRWTNRIAKSIALLVPLLSIAAMPLGGLGPAIVVGLDGVGLGYVVYTLAVRLEGYRLPARVDGAVAIIERLQPPGATATSQIPPTTSPLQPVRPKDVCQATF